MRARRVTRRREKWVYNGLANSGAKIFFHLGGTKNE